MAKDAIAAYWISSMPKLSAVKPRLIVFLERNGASSSIMLLGATSFTIILNLGEGQ
jgi:hypothetical protein